MRSIETTGKTVEEAVLAAQKQLGVGREQLKIEVLEEPAKVLFGLLGGRQAKVRVVVIEDPASIALDFLQETFRAMDITVKIKTQEKEGYIYLSFSGEDLGILIGRRGETLDALQYLVNLVVGRKVEQYRRFILDVEGYRKRREETLMKLARRLSEKVRRTGHNVMLEPMNPHERRVIHTALQNDHYVQTYSEGDEPYRKVVISLRR
jgi:spoIIIJ-associated protein